MSDSNTYSVPAVWSLYYNEIRGTAWDEFDLAPFRYWHNEPSEIRPAIDAMKYVYDLSAKWVGADAEESVLAVLRAALRHHGSAFLTPEQVKEMAGAFACYYDSFEEAAQDWMDEHCGGLRWATLDASNRRTVRDSVVCESELWVDDQDLSGAWVFNKPSA